MMFLLKPLCVVLVVMLSTGVTAAEELDSDWLYTIRPGDTLIGFSNKYLIDPSEWPILQKINKIKNPRRLQPGSKMRIPVAMLRQHPVPARVLVVSGDVTIKMPNEAARKLKNGETLGLGAELMTAAENSSVTLRFADGSTLTVQPDSVIKLDTMSLYEGGGMVDTRFRLQHGDTEVTANPDHEHESRMHIITPSAVAAVRGTKFRVRATERRSWEETLEGKVAVMAAGEEIEVPVGYGSVVERGKPPQPPVALLPAPDVSALSDLIEQLPIRFVLSPQAEASGWYGQIAENNKFDQIILEKSSATSTLSFGDLPDGHYVLRLRTVDADGLHSQNAHHAFEVDARPYPPLLLMPATGALVRDQRPLFHWSEAVGAKAYRVELARDAGFKYIVFNERVSENAYTPHEPLSQGDYYLRVASVDDNDQGPYTPTLKFSYKPMPGAPVLSDSMISFDKDTMTIRLPAPAEGLHYDLELALDAQREEIFWQGESDTSEVEMPRPGWGKCYLSVRLVETDGTAGPYATQIIDVPRKTAWEVLLLLTPFLMIF